MIGRALKLCVGLLSAAVLSAAPVSDLASRTVILVNANQPESVTLGEFYAAQRGIPPDNIVRLPMPGEDEITWHRFVDEVWQPLQDTLMRRGWIKGIAGSKLDRLGRRQASFAGHRIAYLVVCRGTPLRIQHDPTLEPPARRPGGPMDKFRTNQGAVDSELSLLATDNYEIEGFLPNPLFAANLIHLAGAELIVKVSRLDGPSDAAARHLVTSALEAEARGLIGRYYVDLMPQGSPHPDGDRWLGAAATLLDASGLDGSVDRQPAVFDDAARFDAPAVYLGWYTNDLTGPFLRAGFNFPPGAIAEHIHSYSAATLRSATSGWCGPLVARGVAATVGNVYEPYLQMLHRPDLLMQSLLRGETWGEAVYFALPYLSWQSIALGDPLYRPFAVPEEEQYRRLDNLPAGLAPYAVLRHARQLEKQGKLTEADALRQRAEARFPGLVLALARAQASLTAQRPADAQSALAQGFAESPALTDELWPLVREAAQLYVQAGAPERAVPLYRQLVLSSLPSPGAHLTVLGEARQAAEAAGDAAAVAEFKPPAATPPAVLPTLHQ